MKLTEHGRVHNVHTGDEARDGEEEEEEVAAKEVGAEERHLDNLDDELARGLRERGRSESTAVPCVVCVSTVHPLVRAGELLTSSSPPGAVRLVVLELAREADGDERDRKSVV